MKASVILLAALTGLATAAPVTRLAHEIHVPHEINPAAFSLVDLKSGQLRLGEMDGGGQVRWADPVVTGIEEVSDAAAGFSNSAPEFVALTSPLANRVALVDVGSNEPSVVRLTPEGTGPNLLLDYIDGGTRYLAITSILNGDSIDTGLEFHRDPDAASTSVFTTGGLGDIARLSPLNETPAGDRIGAFARYNQSTGRTELGVVAAVAPYRFTHLDLPGDLRITSNVWSQSGELMILAWEPESTTAHLLRVDGGGSSFSDKEITLPAEPGVISPVPPGGVVPGMPDGVLLTTADGEMTFWLRFPDPASVDLAGKFGDDLIGDAITGAVAIPGRGVLRLESDGKGRTAFTSSYLWNGSDFELADQGGIPPLMPPGGAPFASLFFFDDDPILNENATLLGVRSAPDWTRRDSSTAIPANVLRENFVSTATGLGSPTSIAVSTIPGAGYLLTNQVRPALSFAALGDDESLLAPTLDIAPASGTHEPPLQASARYDTSRYRVLWRRNAAGEAWRPFDGPRIIGYPGSYHFVLEEIDTGTRGPITQRTWSFPDDAPTLDSDGDSVPDHVEAAYGLDPSGGADSDGDGISDLEEILQASDPADPDSVPATRDPLPQGEEFAVIALGHDATDRPSAEGAALHAHLLAGDFLGTGQVEPLTGHPTLGGQRGARIESSDPFNARFPVTLSSDLFFDVTGSAPVDRGREIVRVTMPVLPQDLPEIAPTYTDLAADAAAWRSAVLAAVASYDPVTELTELGPGTTAAAVIFEEMLHLALDHLGIQSAAAVPLDDFSSFPARAKDAARSPILPAQLDALVQGGLDFDSLVALADSTAAEPAIESLADAIYAHHIANFDSTPTLPLPLDALRQALRDGLLPASYAGAATAPELAAASAVAETGVAGWSDALRPTATWVVEIEDPSPGPGIYHRPAAAQLVRLLTRELAAFRLEQGIGLAPGSRFSVSGFTDVPSPDGLAAMEVIAVVVASLPAASDRDLDGNLLDDEWERFFFGATGNDPYSNPPGSTYSLLQHFLAGTDPRSGGTEEPSGVPVDLRISGPRIVTAADGSHRLDFAFPAAYQDRFDFTVESSTTLSGFSNHSGASVSGLAGDGMRAVIPADGRTTSFFRIRMSLR